MFGQDAEIWTHLEVSNTPKNQAYIFNGNGFEPLVIATAKEGYPEPRKDRTPVPAPRTL